MEENDGIEDSLNGMMRTAVMAGTRFAESLGREIERKVREREAERRTEARELATRFDAERSVAVADLRPVHRPDWWDKASPEQVGRTLATAQAWREHEPEAAFAERRIRAELSDRYGIDVDAAGGDPARVQEQVARWEAERLQRDADLERQREQQERGEATATLAEADRLDREAERAEEVAVHEPDPAEREQAHGEGVELRDRAADAREDSGVSYDSAERRARDAAKLEGKAIDHDVIATRMRADVSQGAPATEAVATKRAAKARKGRTSTTPGLQQQRAR
ncbi:hypothetical protein [Pseudoclavibacter sp. RFBA6]|uniref:hypothetical protein n=1 Tax=Pseudoclavibacter sp. RFBA6 TaxID=2080573 RepID=UPI000CE8FAC1|nr:hypothetical protein [Pseudoclavibacter sp. RFBA6]PPG43732.1 hypothetical protein C5C17_00410 [Pseudoclavibacter sp. RFBA6]